jgi:regulator of cell morphogenesis and NO signaling
MNVMAEIIAEDYTNTNDELNLLLFYFNKLSADQITHMEKEEAILFPYIKSLFNPDSDNPIEHVCFGSIKSPVSVIEMEHDNAVLELEYLRNLTNNYEAPEWAGPLLCNFYKDLETMEKDLLLHLYKENNILHPKAIEREAEIYS